MFPTEELIKKLNALKELSSAENIEMSPDFLPKAIINILLDYFEKKSLKQND